MAADRRLTLAAARHSAQPWTRSETPRALADGATLKGHAAKNDKAVIASATIPFFRLEPVSKSHHHHHIIPVWHFASFLCLNSPIYVSLGLQALCRVLSCTCASTVLQ